jgi:hypothetical protein
MSSDGEIEMHTKFQWENKNIGSFKWGAYNKKKLFLNKWDMLL